MVYFYEESFLDTGVFDNDFFRLYVPLTFISKKSGRAQIFYPKVDFYRLINSPVICFTRPISLREEDSEFNKI